jgi:hypothetical protein
MLLVIGAAFQRATVFHTGAETSVPASSKSRSPFASP